MDNDLIVIKKKDKILIYKTQSKLIINKNNKLFNKLINLSIEQIKDFILKGGDK